MTSKTGSFGRLWVELERPKPAPHKYVSEQDDSEQPEHVSARCLYWVRQIRDRGWLPNRAGRMHCADCLASWLGIRSWESRHLVRPLILRMAAIAQIQHADQILNRTENIETPAHQSPSASAMSSANAPFDVATASADGVVEGANAKPRPQGGLVLGPDGAADPMVTLWWGLDYVITAEQAAKLRRQP